MSNIKPLSVGSPPRPQQHVDNDTVGESDDEGYSGGDLEDEVNDIINSVKLSLISQNKAATASLSASNSNSNSSSTSSPIIAPVSSTSSSSSSSSSSNSVDDESHSHSHVHSNGNGHRHQHNNNHDEHEYDDTIEDDDDVNVDMLAHHPSIKGVKVQDHLDVIGLISKKNK